MGTNDSLFSSEISHSLCQSFTCKKWQNLQPQPFGEGCWAVEQYRIVMTQYVDVFICAHCLFYVFVNLGFNVTLPGLCPSFLLPTLIVTRGFWSECCWPTSQGSALDSSKQSLSGKIFGPVGLLYGDRFVCISPTARDPCSVKSTEGKDGKRWGSLSCWVLLCLTFLFMWPNK